MSDQWFELDEAGDEGELDSRESTETDREIELAAELLSVSNEQELDEFFGKLLRRGRGRLRSPARRKLRNLLRRGTRRVLPFAGSVPVDPFAGDDAPPDVNPDASDDGDAPDLDPQQMFGIETEGLSPEDRDLEIARRVVRLGGDAAQRLSDAPSGDAAQAARRALLDAAQRHAPGLASHMRESARNPLVPPSGRSNDSAGRWIRDRGAIVLLGVHPSTPNDDKGEPPMHDLDRTLRSQESEGERYDFEAELFGESEGDYEGETAISEEAELDLAAELLAVSDENELDQFIGGLLKRAGRAVLPVLKKYVKPLARKIIPFAGKAIGGYFGGPAGAAIGGKLGSYASSLFEVDFESMDGETQDLEVARHFVRFATAAANNAASSMGTGGNPATVARAAVIRAARTHAPGLIRPRVRVNDHRRSNLGEVSSPTVANSGRWIRRDGRIVLLGA